MFLTSTNACSPSEPFVGNIPRTLTCDATALSCWSTIIRASHLVVCQDCDTKIMIMIIDQLWQNPATWLSSRNSCASLSLFTSTARAEVLDRSQSTSVSFSRPLFCLKHHPNIIAVIFHLCDFHRKAVLVTLSVDASRSSCLVPLE